MPAYTTHLNLYLPGGGSLGIGGDDEEADIDKINQNMQALDAWSATSDTRFTGLEGFQTTQTGRNQQFSGTAANLGSVTGMKRGDTYQETDDNFQKWEYDGSNWLLAMNGMYLIYPATVAGTGVSIDAATGEVVFAAATPASGITINGIFSSRFKKYRLDISIDSAAGGDGNTSLQMCVAGVANASNNYHYVYNETSVGTGPARTGASAASSAFLGRHSTVGGSTRLELLNPALASVKFGRFESIDGSTIVREGGFVTSGTVNVVSDGVKIAPVLSTSITGRIRVYGLA